MTGVNKDEKGMMTVEAVLCLVPFILAVLGIISFANVFMVQNKIQHALYESASELSAYTYLYQVSKWRGADKTFDVDSEKLTAFLESFDKAREALDKLTNEKKSGDNHNAAEAVTDVVGEGVELVQNPKELVQGIIAMLLKKGSDGIKDVLVELLESLMINKYLEHYLPDGTGQSADEYLKAYGVKNGVKGFNFDNSTLFTDDSRNLIDIVVDYDLEIYFFKLFMKDPTIHVVQRVTVPAWLDGDGGTYHAD